MASALFGKVGSRSWFYLFRVWVLILSMSFEIGSYIYTGLIAPIEPFEIVKRKWAMAGLIVAAGHNILADEEKVKRKRKTRNIWVKNKKRRRIHQREKRGIG